MKIFRKYLSPVAMVWLLSIMFELCWPLRVFALTGGPSQPEVESFTPVGTSDLVDPFSGDFNYNIPLLDVDGYPINVAYHSGVTMDQEASWTGLGWNVNPGVINRNMRGLPDDFNGVDKVTTLRNLRNNESYGVNVGFGVQVAGFKISIPGGAGLSVNVGLGYNNYNGYNFEFGLGMSVTAGKSDKNTATAGLGLNASSDKGLGISPNLSFSSKQQMTGQATNSYGGSMGLNFNSKEGFKGMSFGANCSTSRNQVKKNAEQVNGAFKEEDKVQRQDDKGKTEYSMVNLGASSGSSISFLNPTYMPTVEGNMANVNFSLAFTLGGEAGVAHISGNIGGYYSRQWLTEKQTTSSAYGYFYAEKALHDVNGMMDFNREKDVPYKKDATKYLALASQTYDIFSVTGQGVSGCFRPHRFDVGTVADKVNTSEGGDGSIGGEVGLGYNVHGGVDVKANYSSGSSGRWVDDNHTDNFQYSDQTDPNQEKIYFQEMSEMTPDADDQQKTLMDDHAFRMPLQRVNDRRTKVFDSYLVNTTNDGTPLTPSGWSPNVKRTKRKRRNQLITYLSNSERSQVGLDRLIKSYGSSANPNNFVFDNNAGDYLPQGTPPGFAGASGHAPHHISEVTNLTADGRRYIYGIPTYINKNDEVSFAVNGQRAQPADGTVLYTPGSDDDVNNNNQGTDHYVNEVKMPPYSYSYLLTGILSSDYSDLTGNGISDDDLGSYTKFNYSKVYDDYQWRVPYQANTANYNQGLRHTTDDDKGSFVHGAKEIWYLHSIVTKNYVAEFHVSRRHDSYGVAGRSGGINTNQPLYKLDEIVLYSKRDKMTNGATAIPIKTVHFEYDYSLCPHVPNNDGIAESVNSTNINANQGKLTLKRVWFSYGNSYKAKFSSYQFDYGSFNPAYAPKEYDRWGNYKPNDPSMPNAEFPYVTASKEDEDKYAHAWTLESIKLPSGGEIDVKYESDDYAYVQNKQAMHMLGIKGMAASNNPGTITNASASFGNSVVQLHGSNIYGINNYVFFDLPRQSMTDADVKNEMISTMTQIQFKLLSYCTPVGGASNGSFTHPEAVEWIQAYADIDKTGAYAGVAHVNIDGSNQNYGYVKLRNVAIGSKQPTTMISPLAQTTLNFIRMSLPRLANQQPPPSGDAKNIVTAMASAFDQFKLGFNRQNLVMYEEWGYAHAIVKDKSTLRLYAGFEPNGDHESPTDKIIDCESVPTETEYLVQRKLGGGSRVKLIYSLDNWYDATSHLESNSSYGQVYDYRVKVKSATDDAPAMYQSSGVASYEPLIGNEENPWRQPKFMTQDMKMVPDVQFFAEEPFGESFFPVASVGYSQVSVATIPIVRGSDGKISENKKVQKHRTGKVVNTFYTYKDFPTRTEVLNLKTYNKKPNPLFKFLKFKVEDFLTASQGYAIILNDMQGKPKGKFVYAEGKTTPLSSIEYFYKTDANGDLASSVDVIRKNGDICQKRVGVDQDVVLDSRQSDHNTTGGGLQINIEFFLAGPIPITIPPILPDFSMEEVRFRSLVTTKVVNHFGILERTVAKEDGSTITTTNLAWDEETGQVLLTRTENQFKDPVYNFTYPAHWAYDGMGQAYKNIGYTKPLHYESPGVYTALNLAPGQNLFFPGDELLIDDVPDRLWVLDVQLKPGSATDYNIYIIDRFGNPLILATDPTVKVIRSGRRNQPMESIGSIAMLTDPRNAGHLDFSHDPKVLNASVQTYSDRWQMYCKDALRVNRNQIGQGKPEM